MLWEGLEGIWGHLGGFWEAFGGIWEALGGSWVAFGGIWDPLGPPQGQGIGAVKVKSRSGGATRGPNQQDTNQPDLLIPDQQLDSIPDWQTGNWRLEETGLENSRFADCKPCLAAWWPLASRGRRISVRDFQANAFLTV